MPGTSCARTLTELPGQTAPQVLDLLLPERGRLQSEQTGPAVANLLAKITPRAQQAQHSAAIVPLADHYALLCVAAAATRHQFASYYANNNLTSGACQVASPAWQADSTDPNILLG